MKPILSLFLVLLLFQFQTVARAEEDIYTRGVVAHVDLTAQRMHVSVDGIHSHTWKISSGKSGFLTPTGSFRPKFLHRMHYSRQYDNSPMPHSVFFYRGYAVHGTSYVKKLGQPASHGCIRLSKENARTFFNLVKVHGKAETQITLTGRAPGATRHVKKKSTKKRRARSKTKQRRHYLAKKRKRALKLKRKRAQVLVRRKQRERLAARRRSNDPFAFLFGN